MKKKIIIISSAVLVLAASGATWVVNTNNRSPVTKSNVAILADKPAEDADKKEVEPVEVKEITNTEQPATPVSSTELPPQPASKEVLTTQQYGEMYLDLSKTEYQTCFDLIVNKWPERFNEDVRENNVKALKVWADMCSTGIERPVVGYIYQYGQNGEFFDSDLAKTQY